MKNRIICGVCGREIGGPGSKENVMVVRHVRTVDGRSGWIPAHMRCAGWPCVRRPLALPVPPGGVLDLTVLEAQCER